MRFTVERDVLADAVTWVARAVPARPPIPVLAGVRIIADRADGGTLTLSSFDYEVSARVEVAAAVDDPGEILVSGKLLADISRLLPAKPVHCEIEGAKAVLTCGSSRFTLLSMPTEDYPSLPSMPQPSGSVDGATFLEAVSQVSVAASRDETLPLLTGIRMEFEGEKLTMLATDRYRLSMRELTWQPSDPALSTVALVKARTLLDVAKSLGAGAQLSLSLTEPGAGDIIGFEAGGRHTTSMLMDGDYPAVRRLFPESSPIHAVIEVATLTEAVRRVALVAERNTAVRLSLTEGQGVLNAGQGDEAQASEAIEAQFDAEPITVAFNPSYLLDGLSAMNAKYVRLSMTHPSKPVLFTGQEDPSGEQSNDFQYLLVPIRFAG